MKKFIIALLILFSFHIHRDIQGATYEGLTMHELLVEIKNDIPLESRHYYNRLTEAEKIHYDGILQSYLDGHIEGEYTFQTPSAPEAELAQKLEELSNAYHAFSYEHKEFFFIGTHSTTSYYSLPPEHDIIEFKITIMLAADYYTSFDPNDLDSRVLNTTLVKQHFVEILNKRDEIIDQALLLETDDQKLKYVHDYLVLNKEYEKTNELSHTPAGALVDGQTPVCEAYSEAFQMLAHRLGIPVLYATGEAFSGGSSELHAWNHVKLGTKWYLVDVTWDDPVGMPADYVSYDYFLIPKLSESARVYDEYTIIPTPFTTTDYSDKEVYQVTIEVDGQTLTKDVLEGDDVDLSDLEKEGYDMHVVGNYQNIQQNETLSITYTVKVLTIRFISGSSVLKTETLNYNEQPTPPQDPTREKYIFNGWSPSVSKATKDQDYRAQWILEELYDAPKDENPLTMILILSGIGVVGFVGLVIGFKLLFKRK